MVILKTKTGNIPANENEIVFTDVVIEDDSIIEVYYDNNNVYTLETWQTGDSVHVITSPHDFQVGVKLLINNVGTFSPYNDTPLWNEVNAQGDQLVAIVDAMGELEGDIGENTIAINILSEEKQDSLIAGENITIENNVISVTPGGSGQEIYDDTERVIGTWFGKPLYRRVISFVLTSNITTYNYNFNIERLVNSYGTCENVSIPSYNLDDAQWSVMHTGATTSMTVRYGSRRSAFLNKTCFMVLEYTKVGD